MNCSAQAPRFNAGIVAGLNFAELEKNGNTIYFGLNAGIIGITKIIILLPFLLLIFINSTFGQDINLADQYFKIAEEWRKNQNFDSALVYYEKASIEFPSLKDAKNQIRCYNQIGVILTRQDKYEEAKAILNKALSIGLISLDSNNLEIATTYISLGVVYNAEENYSQSLIFHDKALKIRLLQLGKMNSQTATSYGNIGNVYLNAKEYDKSVETHLKAMKIREKVFGKKSAEIIDSYKGLGNAYREKKNYRKSLKYFIKAQENKLIQRGQGHKDLVKYYKQISEVYYLMGDKLNGDRYKIKADDIENIEKL